MRLRELKSGTWAQDLNTTDWAPILCPQCWAMRFFVNNQMAQCYYCGYVIMKLEKQ